MTFQYTLHTEEDPLIACNHWQYCHRENKICQQRKLIGVVPLSSHKIIFDYFCKFCKAILYFIVNHFPVVIVLNISYFLFVCSYENHAACTWFHARWNIYFFVLKPIVALKPYWNSVINSVTWQGFEEKRNYFVWTFDKLQICEFWGFILKLWIHHFS